MKYETLIFDLDGTISDPFAGLSQSINFALESQGFRAVDPERIRPLIGPPLHEIFPTLAGSISGDQLDRLIDKYREHYGEIGYAENTIYADIPATVSRLAEAGYRMGICTAKRADYASKIIDMFGLDRFFAFIDGGAGIGKQNQLARIIASGVDPATAIMIGDRDADILAATATNLHSVGVLWGFGDRIELEAAKPNFLMQSPDELQSLFL